MDAVRTPASVSQKQSDVDGGTAYAADPAYVATVPSDFTKFPLVTRMFRVVLGISVVVTASRPIAATPSSWSEFAFIATSQFRSAVAGLRMSALAVYVVAKKITCQDVEEGLANQ